MTHKRFTAIAILALTVCALGVHAQGIRPAYSYPGTEATGGNQIGQTPLYFAPLAGIAAGHDDNVLLTENNRTSSPLYIAGLGFKVGARSESSVFQARYLGQMGRYTSSEDDNYTDHTFRAQYDVAFSGRSFLRLDIDYLRGHDQRGSTDRPDSNTPDKYRLNKPGVTYAYGAPGAQGRLEAYYSDAHIVYLNNREFTALSDRKTQEYGGAFYWRVMPKTYLLAEVRQTDISYDLTNPASGDERRYYGGVSWEATAATTGTVKVGQLRRRFESEIPSAKDTSWEALITWAPRTYSTFDFYSSRQTNESTGQGDYILSSISGINWNHAWSSVLNTGVTLRFQRDEYQGFDRSDDVKTIGFRVGYKMRRWLTLGAEYQHTQRDSNVDGLDYTRNLYLLTATAGM